MQVDVIEAGHSRLRAAVAAADGLAAAAAAHEAFVDGCVSAALLDVRNLHASLMALFSLCRRLCARLQVRAGRAVISLTSLRRSTHTDGKCSGCARRAVGSDAARCRSVPVSESNSESILNAQAASPLSCAQENAAGDSLDEALADAQLQRDVAARLASVVAVLRADYLHAHPMRLLLHWLLHCSLGRQAQLLT